MGEMSAPGSANSFNMQMINPRRNRGCQLNNNHNIRVKPFQRHETYLPIKIELNKKSFIDWKAIVVNKSDLNGQDNELFGFSPPNNGSSERRIGMNNSILTVNGKI